MTAEKDVQVARKRRGEVIRAMPQRKHSFSGGVALQEEDEGGKARRIFIDANNSMQQEAKTEQSNKGLMRFC